MKSYLIKSIKVLSIILLIGLGTSFVFAWSAPDREPTQGNVTASVNQGDFSQSKIGRLFDEKALISPWGIIHQIFLPGSNSRFRIGSDGSTIGSDGSTDVNLSTSGFNDTSTIPLAIDLAKRPTSNALEVYSDQTAQCPINKKVTFVADTAPAFQLWNASKNQNADLIARQVQLTGGSPGAGKVLTSDADGNASWGTVNASGLNGKVVPDVKMVFGRFAQNKDKNSDTVYCPDDYAAVSVACDSTGDRGHDTCRINHNYPNGSAITVYGLGANNDLATTATVSRSGTAGNVDVSIWLTCMRYQNFPPVNLVTAGTSPVLTDQQCAAPPIEDWVKGKTCTGLSYEIPSGYSRARVVEKVTHNGEPLLKYYNDSCLVREKVDASVDPTRPFLCHAVPVGEGSGTYQNETITTSCTDTGGNNNDFYQEFLKE